MTFKNHIVPHNLNSRPSVYILFIQSFIDIYVLYIYISMFIGFLTIKKCMFAVFMKYFHKHSTLITMFSYTQVSPPGPEGGHS